MRPLELGANEVQRFFAGGPAIRSFRGLPPHPEPDPHAPEDWVGSTTTVWGEDSVGLSRLPDGRLLRDAVEEDPAAFLGEEHRARFGPDVGLLVKLLDAGQRLPVHAHPSRDFARAQLGLSYGKTEAWVVLAVVGDDPRVWLGFDRDVDKATLAGWVERQDVDEQLVALGSLGVKPGDSVLVPAGVPHAIGAGVFVVELQEPTDLSVLLEWEGFGIDGTSEGHLGLGYDRALDAVDRRGWSHEQRAALFRSADPTTPGRLLPDAAAPFFRADRLVSDGDEQPPGYAVLVVTQGAGAIEPSDGARMELSAGATVLVPYASGPYRLLGDLTVVRCRPPVQAP